MSNTAKTGTALVIVLAIIIIAGVIWGVSSTQKSSMAPRTVFRTTPAPVARNNSMAAPNNTSNAAIDQDLSSINIQLDAVNLDASNADQALNASSTAGM